MVCDSFFPFCILVSNCGYQYSSKAFLFSLVNMPGLAPLKLFQKVQHSSGRNSIYSCSSYGPTFGGGNDIYIASYASSSTKSYSNLGYTYRSPPGHSYSSSSNSFLAGSRSFKPDEVEVFYETTWNKRTEVTVIFKAPIWPIYQQSRQTFLSGLPMG